MPFLEINSVNKVFQDITVVKNFNLHVEQGEFISFLGPSGCGKTTTLRIVAGFEQPSSGTVRLAGADITTQPPNRRNVGMVFQSYALFPNMTVADNVAFGLTLRKKPKDQIQRRVRELLELIHLPDRSQNYPAQLSGGQQQRVALARALAFEPQVLLLDEPLSALDAKIRDELRVEIRRIQQRVGITTIYVTHDQQEAMALSDRVVVMSQGLVEQVGTPFEVYNYPQTSFVAAFVGTLNTLSCAVVDAAQGTLACQGQVFETGAPIAHPAGHALALMLRPEELRYGPGGGQNRLAGEVLDVSFLGATVRVRLKLGGSTLTADLFNERMLVLPRIGETHTFSFPPHACWIMPQQPAN